MFDEQRHIFRAIGERRHLDAHDIEAIEQVGAEMPAVDGGEQVDAGGGDEANVDGNRQHAADALDNAGFERAEKLHLHGRRHVADFIEEQRAGVGGFEAAGAGLDGAGEGAGFVAEHFAFEQVGATAAQLSATNGRAARRLRWCSNCATTSLPEPDGPGDQHRGRGIGDGFNLGTDGPDRRAVADEAGQLGRLPGSKGR